MAVGHVTERPPSTASLTPQRSLSRYEVRGTMNGGGTALSPPSQAHTLDLKVTGSRQSLVITVAVILASPDFNQRFSEPVGLGPQLLKSISVSRKAEKWPLGWRPLPRAEGGLQGRGKLPGLFTKAVALRLI